MLESWTCRPRPRRAGGAAITPIAAAIAASLALVAAMPLRAEEAASAPDRFTREERAYWAFQPLARPAVPTTGSKHRAVNAIDAFIYARLEGAGISPSPRATPRELVRRLWLDVLGLLPSPEEIDAYEVDPRPDAWERLVDRVLASPRYGERFGRQWLDVVRYAESDGFRADGYRPLAWKYRDWVVDSFNEDKPFDRFLAEQIAGDEAFPDSPDAIVATGYLRLFPYEHNQRNLHLHRDEILDDITRVTSEAFLGLSLGCARCHDHKFDPLLQKDYYRLRAFFEALQPRDDLVAATPEERERFQSELARWEADTEAVRTEIEELARPARQAFQKDAYDKFHPKYQRLIDASPTDLSPLELQLRHLAMLQLRVPKSEIEKRLDDDAKKRWKELHEELARHPRPEPLPPVLGAVDVGPKAPRTTIPGDEDAGPVAPGFPAILEPRPPVIPASPRNESTGRRSALARWLNRDDHPLVPRVIVNRIWQSHFGRGLVATPNDFGKLGEPPSHPELLDWLAVELVESGRSLKHLHRLILSSEIYRQSARIETEAQRAAARVDPANRLLWRMPVRRLEAEAIRDEMLAASGELDLAMGGPSAGEKSSRRSVYLEVRRNSPTPFERVFDGPDGFNSCGRRDVTITAPQSLFLLDNAWILERARSLSKLVTEQGGSDPARLDLLYRRVLGRSPRPDERRAAEEFLEEQSKHVGAGTEPAREEAWVDLAHVLLNTNEFLYTD